MLSALLRRLRSSYGFNRKLCGEGANGNKYRKIPQRHHADAIVCTRSLNGASCVQFCIVTLGAWAASGQLKRRIDRVKSLAAAAFSTRTAHPPRGTNTAVGPQTSCTERLLTNWFGFIKKGMRHPSLYAMTISRPGSLCQAQKHVMEISFFIN